MLDRVVAGTVPRKHHIALRSEAGELRYEECLTREGFDGPYTIAYHERRPRTASRCRSPRHNVRSRSGTTGRRPCRGRAGPRSTAACRCSSTTTW